MKKSVTFGKSAQDELIAGVNILCDAVKSTLGAGGRLVLMGDANDYPVSTKDGFTGV